MKGPPCQSMLLVAQQARRRRGDDECSDDDDTDWLPEPEKNTESMLIFTVWFMHFQIN